MIEHFNEWNQIITEIKKKKKGCMMRSIGRGKDSSFLYKEIISVVVLYTNHYISFPFSQKKKISGVSEPYLTHTRVEKEKIYMYIQIQIYSS